MTHVVNEERYNAAARECQSSHSKYVHAHIPIYY